ncbi:MAG: hypothetical protein JXB44_05975 [Calditrichaceae bacterium]|nr:hypothetical protein [Calditrichaceae bacterium]RQV95809.1 MAG: hypothetical protein EH224_06450 [Calditrichota bacterium]
MKLSLFLLPILLIVSLLSAQQKRSDKGTFIDKQSGYWDEIETALEDYHALKDKKEPKKKICHGCGRHGPAGFQRSVYLSMA